MHLRPLAALAIALAFTSCTGGTDGIFATIEKEKKIVSLGGLSSTATITHMAESTSMGKYFATGGRALFSRSITSTKNWDNATVGGSSQVVAVGTTGGTTVWAVAGSKLWKSVDGSTWTDIALANTTDAATDLVPIRAADGMSANELLVVTSDSDGNKNRVYRIGADGSTVTAAALVGTTNTGGTVSITGLRYPVVAAVYDGSDYYLANENYLWHLDGSFGSATVVDVSGPRTGYRGLIFVTGQGYFLTTRSNGGTGGGIYTAASGGNALGFTTLVSDAGKNSVPLSLGTLLYNDKNASLWVATEGAEDTYEGQGYVELTLPGDFDTDPRTDSNNFRSSDLRTSAVKSFFRASDGTYFLGTWAHGLWTWKWAGTDDDSTWSQQ